MHRSGTTKILHVIPYFTPKRGGDVNVCLNLSIQMVRKGHKVTIIVTDFELDRRFADMAEENGIRILVFPCLANLSLYLFSPSMKSWLNEHISEYDLVHLHDFRTYQNVIASKSARKHSIPYILHAHGDIPIAVEKRNIKQIFDLLWGRHIIKNASGLLCISEEEAKSYERFAAEHKTRVIYNGMAIDHFLVLPEYGQFRKRYGISGRMFMYLGRIHKSKGIDFLLHAFSKFMKQNDSCKLVIIGAETGYSRELRRLVDDLGIGADTMFLGFLEEHEKIEAMRDADAFFHTVEYMGGVGIAPLEAIMCGTPVVVTDECGEVIRRANAGYFVKYGDTQDLADIMAEILNKPDEGKELAMLGRQFIFDNLSWESVALRVEEFYFYAIEAEKR